MASICAEIGRLRQAIQTSEAQFSRLHRQLAEAESRTLLQHNSVPEPYDALTYGIPDVVRGEVLAALGDMPLNRGKLERDIEDGGRYASQILVPEIGIQGQRKLGSHAVLVIGLGGIGCTAASYLAGAGVGRIGLLDGSQVIRSCIYRQSVYDATQEGMMKVDAVIERLRCLNGDTQLVRHCGDFTGHNIALINDYDTIIDCTSSLAAQTAISDACVVLRRPLISGVSAGGYGQLFVLNSPPRLRGNPLGGPCARCSVPSRLRAKIFPNDIEQSVLGPVDGILGSLAAVEVIKIIISGSNESDDITAIFGPSPGDSMTPMLASFFEFSAFSEPFCLASSLGERDALCGACGDIMYGEVQSNNL